MTQSCKKINGQGPVVSQTFNVSYFNAVNLNLDADVYYTQDNTYKLEIHAQQNILDIIESPVEGRELRLSFQNFNVWKHDRITIYISAPFLNSIGITGSGTIHALQAIHGNNLSMKVTGSGDVNIAQFKGQSVSGDVSGSGSIIINGGDVSSEDLHISGSGTIDLMGMSAATANTHTSGSGSTYLYATDHIDVRISGSGDVYYSGNATVNSSISGSGKVHHRN